MGTRTHMAAVARIVRAQARTQTPMGEAPRRAPGKARATQTRMVAVLQRTAREARATPIRVWWQHLGERRARCEPLQRVWWQHLDEWRGKREPHQHLWRQHLGDIRRRRDPHQHLRRNYLGRLRTRRVPHQHIRYDCVRFGLSSARTLLSARGHLCVPSPDHGRGLRIQLLQLQQRVERSGCRCGRSRRRGSGRRQRGFGEQRGGHIERLQRWRGRRRGSRSPDGCYCWSPTRRIHSDGRTRSNLLSERQYLVSGRLRGEWNLLPRGAHPLISESPLASVRHSRVTGTRKQM